MFRRGIIAMVAVVALASLPAVAQVEFLGNLFVVVKDDGGNPVSGASVKLAGPDYTREATTNAEGKVTFLKLPPAQDYELEISARGHNTSVLQGIRIESLASPEMVVTLGKSTTEERIVVTADTPLLDRRKTGTGAVVNADEIELIPTAREPWAVLATIPGVTTDRVNVAGNESGQQSNFTGNGDSGSSATWVMDGVEFTDNAAEGASATYFDFNSFENIAFVSGGADVESITPGLRLNFVTKQGTNEHSGTIRMLFTDTDLQDSVTPAANPAHVIAGGGAASFAGNSINEVFEKNFDIGGPILRDRLWYWAGYTQNDIDNQVGTTPDRTRLRNISAKVHGQANSGLTNYRAWVTEGDKIKDGRGAGATRVQGTTWDQEGPSPIYSASLSHFFGSNLEISGQWGVSEGGFQLIPKAGTGPGTQVFLDENGVWQNSFFAFVIDRPVDTYTVRGNYFKDAGGWEHEIKFGFRYKETFRNTVSTYAGDNLVAFEGTGGLGGSVNLYRNGNYRDETEHLNVWAGNTMIKGPWAITYGANFSSQEGMQVGATVPGNALLAANGDTTTLPDLVGQSFDPGIEWDNILPRAGVTYTFDRAKRILLRASYGQFANGLGNGVVGFGNPVGPAYLAYGWDDTNQNDVVDFSEIDFAGGLLAASNLDPANPGAFTRVNQINPDLDAPTVDELILGGEYEVLRNFTVGANLTIRERDDDLHTPLYDVNVFGSTGALVPILGGADYDCTGTVSGTLPGTTTAYSEPICTLSAAGAAKTNISRPVMLDNRPGYSQEFTGFEIFATKRLSNRWMARGFFAFNDWEHSFDGQPLSSNYDLGSSQIQNVISGIDGDPTNTQGGTAVDGGRIGFPSAGSGSKSDVWVGSAEWQANLNFLYQLPKGFSVSSNIQAREGYMTPYYHQQTGVTDPDGFTQTKQVQIGAADANRLDDLFLVDLKLAKTFQMEGNTAVELSFETFNLLDEDTTLQVGRNAASASQFLVVRELLSPRIFRFGATINF